MIRFLSSSYETVLLPNAKSVFRAMLLLPSALYLATSTVAAQPEAILLQFIPNDSASGSLKCLQIEKKVILQSAQTWYEEAPTLPTSLVLMPSEEVFEVAGQLVDHQNQKYSFKLEFSFEDKILQSFMNTELLILSGTNGFEGDGIIVEPRLVKDFFSKCVVRQ